MTETASGSDGDNDRGAKSGGEGGCKRNHDGIGIISEFKLQMIKTTAMGSLDCD